ncbi:MAG: ribosomal L7Ae/L30e/S12e/Gadd45 family protein [Eubacterium sp.]
MRKEKILSMLGLARRSGALSLGHDMVQQALLKKRAKLLLFCSDVSPRLISEFAKTIEKHNINTKVIKTDLTMDEIHYGVGYRAGVMTVNDENFSNRITELLSQEENANGN